MKTYVYLISYKYIGGFGDIKITTTCKINYNDLSEIRDIIRKELLVQDVIIINIYYFGKYKKVKR